MDGWDKPAHDGKRMQPVFRFAPSPTGYLHLGHAFSALVDYELCRQAGGRFLLRIEDTDRTRCRPEYETAILEDLAWLGLMWEEPVRRQSEHFAEYSDALARLAGEGLVYPSFMSRTEIAAATRDPTWPRDPDATPLYPGRDRDMPAAEAERRMAAGEPYALRLRMDRATTMAGPLSWQEEETGTVAADPAAWGDVVIARKDTPTSYHLSVVVDDTLQGITHVVRGRDLYQATSVHVLLQKLLGLPSPVYHHHRLILGVDGRKLSKSDGSVSLRALRTAGRTPDYIRRMVGL